MAKSLDVELPHWERSACLGEDTEIFFPDDRLAEVPELAASFCHRCEIRVECLDWALKYNIPYGIWGNTTYAQRKKLRRTVLRVHCPGCLGTDVLVMNDAEICLSCGLSWHI